MAKKKAKVSPKAASKVSSSSKRPVASSSQNNTNNKKTSKPQKAQVSKMGSKHIPLKGSSLGKPLASATKNKTTPSLPTKSATKNNTKTNRPIKSPDKAVELKSSEKSIDKNLAKKTTAVKHPVQKAVHSKSQPIKTVAKPMPKSKESVKNDEALEKKNLAKKVPLKTRPAEKSTEKELHSSKKGDAKKSQSLAALETKDKIGPKGKDKSKAVVVADTASKKSMAAQENKSKIKTKEKEIERSSDSDDIDFASDDFDGGDESFDLDDDISADALIDLDESLSKTKKKKFVEDEVRDHLAEEILALSEDYQFDEVLAAIKSLDFFKNDNLDCLERGCENPSTTAGHCRYHYIKNWKDIKKKQLILSEGRLQALIEEMTNKYPFKYIEAVLNDLADEKSFGVVLKELNIDTLGDDGLDDVSDEDMDDEDIAFETKVTSVKVSYEDAE